MKRTSFHILRVGIAITFIWIGVLIFKSPQAWGSYLQPWAAKLVSIPLQQAMIATAIMDIAVGLLLLVDVVTWAAALLAAGHLIIVLITVGISEITVRDIGLFAGSCALFVDALPGTLVPRLMFWKKAPSISSVTQ